MNIEVVGVSTRNKGAELMLLAIQQHYATTNAKVRLVVSPWFGSYEERARYGLLHTAETRRWNRQSIALSLLPSSVRSAYGLVTEEEIDVVLDASGFAFGDQHPKERSVRFASDVERWKRAGKRVILMPQALGPFGNGHTRDAFKRIVEAADLVYARDSESLKHARATVSNAKNIREAPDLTIGVTVPSSGSASSKGFAAIVPNMRMLDKLSPEMAQRYVPFLAVCANAAQASGLIPKLLLHDAAEDYKVADQIRHVLGFDIAILREPNPLGLKAILGEANLLIGSRFHSLVGALSQGVPAIAAGWSHKYDMLMADYGCPDLKLSPSDSVDRVQGIIQKCVVEHLQITQRLQNKQARLLEKLQEMWQEVDGLIGVTVAA